jgi:hypothetical protein
LSTADAAGRRREVTVDRTARTVAVAVALLVVLTGMGQAKTLTAHSEHSVAAKAGGRVSVDVSFHEVEVKVAPVAAVAFVVDLEVTASASRAQELLDELAPQIVERGSTIAFRSAKAEGWSFSLFGGEEMKGRVRVTMPPGMGLVLDTASGDCVVDGDLGDAALRVDVASGEVTVRGAASEILVDSASGDVELVLAREVPSVLVDTASGNVVIRGAVRELRADTASGDVTASGLVGSASFDTASGEVTARWAAVPVGARAVADTASGGVRLSLPAVAVVAGRLSTASGDIASAFPGQAEDHDRQFRLAGGAGAVDVRVDTASGDIELLKE